jgi:hypothetical protein
MSEIKIIPDGVDQDTAIVAIAWEITKESMKYKTTEGELRLTPETYIDKITELFRRARQQLLEDPGKGFEEE